MTTRAQLLQRILSRVRIEPTGCWVWTARKSRNGYGRISVRGTERVVHRVMYMLAGGVAFDGEHVDHLCRNRACCNPHHLEAVSAAVNTRRGLAGSGPRGADGQFVSAEVH